MATIASYYALSIGAENLRASVDRARREHLASTMTDVRVPAGELVYWRGEPSVDHFFIVEGEVTDDAPTRTFAERSLIGTIDLMVGRPRSRTATATRNTHLLRMAAQDRLDMFEDNFELTRSGVQGLAAGINELRIALGDVEVNVAGSAPPARLGAPDGNLGLIDRIFALRSVALFAEADVQALLDLAMQAQEVTFEAGEAVFERGASNDALYVVVSGEVSARRAASGHLERFGRGKLVFGSAAAATEDLAHEARAATATRALRIAREDYLDVMEEHFALACSSLKAISLEREVLVNEKGRRDEAAKTSAV